MATGVHAPMARVPCARCRRARAALPVMLLLLLQGGCANPRYDVEYFNFSGREIFAKASAYGYSLGPGILIPRSSASTGAFAPPPESVQLKWADADDPTRNAHETSVQIKVKHPNSFQGTIFFVFGPNSVRLKVLEGAAADKYLGELYQSANSPATPPAEAPD